jgi:hypothetical protein
MFVLQCRARVGRLLIWVFGFNGGRMIRLYVLVPGLLLLGWFSPLVCAADVSEKKAAELKWAEGVATDFFDAAFNSKLEQAESLIDSSLKKVFAKEGENRLREWLNNSIAIQGYHDPVFESKEIAPDRDEASFKGTFKGREKRFQFSLRVIKDKESGKWRVSHFQFREKEQKK